MSFVPPRCPNVACDRHRDPDPGFYRPYGRYHPRCRLRPIPRYCCRTCGKSFSRQTFRHDYRDRRPECNVPLMRLMISGCGLRQAGRQVGLGVHAVQKKVRKLARTCALLHENLSPTLPAGRTYLLDEEETYEAASIRPLTMPVLIEKDTWFVVATAVGPIRRLAPEGSTRRRRQEAEERIRGRRPDRSRRCVREVLRALHRRIAGELVLRTDQKASYATVAKSIFGPRLAHETTAGTDPRTVFNPLFPINATLAMTRDNCGRLRRKSWLVTKKAARLLAHLALFTVYRNYVRRRFNRDPKADTPGKLLGLLPRHLHPSEVLAWRQDWAGRSVHPMSHLGDRAIGSGNLQKSA